MHDIFININVTKNNYSFYYTYNHNDYGVERDTRYYFNKDLNLVIFMGISGMLRKFIIIGRALFKLVLKSFVAANVFARGCM